MRERKLLTWLLCCLLFLLPAMAQGEPEGLELLENRGFELLDETGMPAGWVTEQYQKQPGYTNFAIDTAETHEGVHSARIENLGDNDARFAQTVAVEPESLYCFSGYIRTADVPDSGLGANLSVEGLYVFSDSVYDSDGGWQYVELYGETGPSQNQVTVFARLGGYSGESRGTAWFDGLSLKKVDEVPVDAAASLWFQPDLPEQIQPIAPEDDSADAQPFWPWLLLLAAIYGGAAIWVLDALMNANGPSTLVAEKRSMPGFLVAALVVAALARLVMAFLVGGYQVDVNCFRAWGATMAQAGPSGFYVSTQFCDYPPAYLYVLWMNQGLLSLLTRVASPEFTQWFAVLGLGSYADVMSIVVIKLMPMAFDLLGAWIIYRAGRELLGRRPAALLSAFMAFQPAFFLNSAAWCQMDSVLCVGLLLVALLAIRRKWQLVLPLYVLCILIKPQALMLGFLGLATLVMCWLRHREDRRPMLVGVGVSVAVLLAVVLPFAWGNDLPWTWLFDLYSKTLGSYSYATVNMANIYYLFGGNWVSTELSAGWALPLALCLMCAAWSAVTWIRQRGRGKWFWVESAGMACLAVYYLVAVFVRPSYTMLGIPAMAACILLTLGMVLRSGKLEHLPLAGGILFVLLCCFGLKMHERYLLPALLFFGLAFVLRRDRRIFLLMVVSGLTLFINAGIVLDNSIRLGSSMGHLNNDTRWLNLLLSGINLLNAFLALWTGQRIMSEGQSPEDSQRPLPWKQKPLEQLPGGVLAARDRSALNFQRVDAILIAAVTLAYGALALCNLGSTKAPQRPWRSTDATEQVVIDLGQHYDDFRMLYFAQVSYGDFSVAVSEDGMLWSEEHWAEMNQGECFRWKYLNPYALQADGKRIYNGYSEPETLSGRYVRITAQQIGLNLNEVIFRTADQQVLPAQVVARSNANERSELLSDPAALLDEQDTLTGEPSWYNGTYFDEIYHARTAYELAHGESVYEWTHPPLGKVLMSWCVQLFGMTPFGWRFAGCMAGILMLPFMYLLGKQLTKRRDLAFAAMALMALDCMHLAQTRIATIDSFPVLFIMMSCFFMLRFMQRDLLTPLPKLMLDLALSGFSISLAIASKWIGLYAGVGLAVLYFWTCGRHLRHYYEAKELLAEDAVGLTAEQRQQLQARCEKTIPRLLQLCLWCVLVFVLLPVAIYLLSYIPQFASYGALTPKEFLAQVIKVQQDMYNYHSTPGLGMDHPFYSPWYDWLFIRKPMYFAADRYVPEGYGFAIFTFGNPLVWIGGLVGILVCCLLWCRGHVYRVTGSQRMIHGRSSSLEDPAFVLIGFLSQLLPWVLVPRGTYIYHYFASVPFLILGAVLALQWMTSGRFARVGRWLMVAYLLLTLLAFIGFYPYASGVMTPTWWLDFMRHFLNVYY